MLSLADIQLEPLTWTSIKQSKSFSIMCFENIINFLKHVPDLFIQNSISMHQSKRLLQKRNNHDIQEISAIFNTCCIKTYLIDFAYKTWEVNPLYFYVNFVIRCLLLSYSLSKYSILSKFLLYSFHCTLHNNFSYMASLDNIHQ